MYALFGFIPGVMATEDDLVALAPELGEVAATLHLVARSSSSKDLA
jgi:Ser/Thr protein kinase RdoA (MazF antagonist)